MRDSDFELEDKYRENQVTLAKDYMQRFLLPTKGNGYTGMDNLFVESVKRAMNYEKINTNATVIWGDIHTQYLDEEHRSPSLKKQFTNKTMSRCFNSVTDWLPLQTVSTSKDNGFVISATDCHPNKYGCQRYAEHIQKFIASIS